MSQPPSARARRTPVVANGFDVDAGRCRKGGSRKGGNRVRLPHGLTAYHTTEGVGPSCGRTVPEGARVGWRPHLRRLRYTARLTRVTRYHKPLRLRKLSRTARQERSP